MKPLLVLLLALAGISGVWARDIGHDEARALRQAGTILPLEQITARALQDHPGARLLEVELEEEDGVLVYEVELLTTSGVVRELELDAGTAEVLKDEVD
jgi:uncharacterized membrane protein YkoI